METTTNLSEFVAATPDSVLLDNETVSSQVHEQARESHQILRDADSGTVPGEKHKELVLVDRPNAGAEPFRAATGTFNYMLKKYSIDNETWNESNAVNDGFYQSVFATDEAEHKINAMVETITSENHADILPDGESWKPTGERNPDFFPAVSFSSFQIESSGSSIPLNPADRDDMPVFIDTFNDMEMMLPAIRRPNAKWYMNSNARNAIRKIRDSDGDPILLSTEPGIWHLFGYPVVECDAINDIPTISTPDPLLATFIMFGDMGSSVKVSDIEGISKFINNPYNDGYKTLKYETKYGVYPLDTTSLILGVMDNKNYVVPTP